MWFPKKVFCTLKAIFAIAASWKCPLSITTTLLHTARQTGQLQDHLTTSWVVLYTRLLPGWTNLLSGRMQVITVWSSRQRANENKLWRALCYAICIGAPFSLKKFNARSINHGLHPVGFLVVSDWSGHSAVVKFGLPLIFHTHSLAHLRPCSP